MDGAGFRFDNSYARLPEVFFSRVKPIPVRAPRLVAFNRALAAGMGLDADGLDSPAGAEVFAGNRLPPGAEPIAQAYAGHQFGNFTMLGDGRAILLGEHVGPDGVRRDVQLKGSGRTPYSRRGDGRAALGPMLREHIMGEAMHALGIPTTRSLAVAATGEGVFREEELQGAVLVRVAASHIRVGTFEFASLTREEANVRALVDYTVARHFPECAESALPARALLEAVARRQADLLARWMGVGFIHGVMNTDNRAVSGETIDYGPCAFMDIYDPAAVFSSIDRHGRYAYGNQPAIAHWNLARFAETLLPLFHPDEAKAVEMAKESLGLFTTEFQARWLEVMRAKLGLAETHDGDAEFVGEFLEWMHGAGLDFTNTFRALDPERPPDAVEIRGWGERWAGRIARQTGGFVRARELMRRANPFVIPRNHRVEEALAAAEGGDFSVMEKLMAVLAEPFAESEAALPYAAAPADGGKNHRTFCGT
jgi:uncharacterized protein YdiU (UPF0061 family)